MEEKAVETKRILRYGKIKGDYIRTNTAKNHQHKYYKGWPKNAEIIK